MRVSSLDWMACVLAGLDCGFTIRSPDELRASVKALAARLSAAARRREAREAARGGEDLGLTNAVISLISAPSSVRTSIASGRWRPVSASSP